MRFPITNFTKVFFFTQLLQVLCRWETIRLSTKILFLTELVIKLSKIFPIHKHSEILWGATKQDVLLFATLRQYHKRFWTQCKTKYLLISRPCCILNNGDEKEKKWSSRIEFNSLSTALKCSFCIQMKLLAFSLMPSFFCIHEDFACALRLLDFLRFN